MRVAFLKKTTANLPRTIKTELATTPIFESNRRPNQPPIATEPSSGKRRTAVKARPQNPIAREHCPDHSGQNSQKGFTKVLESYLLATPLLVLRLRVIIVTFIVTYTTIYCNYLSYPSYLILSNILFSGERGIVKGERE